MWILPGSTISVRAVEAAQLDQIVRYPNDVLVYGFLVDGYVELGRYSGSREGSAVDAGHAAWQRPWVTRARTCELFGP